MKKPRYELWLIGYNKDAFITDYDKCVETFDNADKAVKYAIDYIASARVNGEDYPDDVDYVDVSVEKVVDRTNYTENIETIFSTVVAINK